MEPKQLIERLPILTGNVVFTAQNEPEVRRRIVELAEVGLLVFPEHEYSKSTIKSLFVPVIGLVEPGYDVITVSQDPCALGRVFENPDSLDYQLIYTTEILSSWTSAGVQEKRYALHKNTLGKIPLESMVFYDIIKSYPTDCY